MMAPQAKKCSIRMTFPWFAIPRYVNAGRAGRGHWPRDDKTPHRTDGWVDRRGKPTRRQRSVSLVSLDAVCCTMHHAKDKKVKLVATMYRT